MRYIMLAYLLLLPLYFQVGVELRMAQERFFQIASIGVFLISFFVKSKPIKSEKGLKSMNMWLAVFGLWTLWLWCFHPLGIGQNVLTNTFLGILVYSVCIRSVRREDIPFLFKGMIGVMAITAIHVFSQSLGYDPIWSLRNFPGQCDTVGNFGFKASLGTYYAIGMPIVAYFMPWASVGILLALYISSSTGVFIGGIAGWLFVLWFRNRKAFWVYTAVGIIATGIFIVKCDMPQGMYDTRPPLWDKVLRDSLQTPRGHGLDSFREGDVRYYREPSTNNTIRAVRGEAQVEGGKELPMNVALIMKNNKGEDIRLFNTEFGVYALKTSEKNIDWWDHAHNEFLMLFYTQGMVGVVVIVLLIYGMFKRFMDSYKSPVLIAVTGAIIALLGCSVTQFPFYLARNAHLVPVILAFFYIETEGEEWNKLL